MKKALATLLLLAAAGGAGWYFFLRPANGAAKYRLAKIEKGDLRVTVTATGQVYPFALVQVGTQVTGTIQKLMVDFNSRVKAGEVVAKIDPAPFQTRVDQDKANLARSEADVGRVKANLVQAEKELARSRELKKRDLISGSDFDAAVANYDSLVAQLEVAKAVVAQSKAALDSSMVSLGYTTITSPINGVVISRNVDVGQTVAASLQAPTIYIIADDMKRVQIQAAVAEADIGRVHADQKVSFTVDAYRALRFNGTVSQVRLQPTTVQNVVTYTVMIDAENPEGKLLLGMTANVSFEIAQYNDVVKVPNAALRFTPPDAPPPPADETAARKPGGRDRERPKENRVWILRGEGMPPASVTVTAGATDGTYSQLVKGELKEGQEVIVGLSSGGGDGPMTSPFGPRFGGGGRGR
jgi:HlyD family secretion protein